jgi:hypothetical protein
MGFICLMRQDEWETEGEYPPVKKKRAFFMNREGF